VWRGVLEVEQQQWITHERCREDGMNRGNTLLSKENNNLAGGLSGARKGLTL